MPLQISALYRQSDIIGDTSKPSSVLNPGGGVVSKVYHLRDAIPSINITNDISEVRHICLAEALWFTEVDGKEGTQKRIEQFSNLDAFKIVWLSDVEIFKIPGYLREQLFDAADVIGTLSDYSQQLVEPFTSKATLLYDPLDIDMFTPGKKRPEIFGIGQISLEKNVESIAKIFQELPKETGLETTYIGSRHVWGLNHRDAHSEKIENMLRDTCDHFEQKLPRRRIARRMAVMWAYISDTGYDFSSYSMMEAMLCGCWLFGGKHLMFDERPCRRFNTTEEAIEQILVQLEETPPESGKINEEARQYIVERNSYDAFKRQLQAIIGERLLGV